MISNFWIDNPNVLLNNKYITQIWPTVSMSKVEKLNAITRLIIILMFLGYIFTRKIIIILTGIVAILVIIFLYYSKKSNFEKKNKKIEGFSFLEPTNKKVDPQKYTMPTVNNPLMNVLPTQINEDPNRKSAAPAYNSTVIKEINKKTIDMIDNNYNSMSNNNIINKFKKTFNNNNNPKTNKISEKLFADTCTGMDTRYNNITFNDSMQRFYSTANTQIPNNQKGFAEWCYGNMPSAKEGDPTALINNAPPHWIGGKQ